MYKLYKKWLIFINLKPYFNGLLHFSVISSFLIKKLNLKIENAQKSWAALSSENYDVCLYQRQNLSRSKSDEKNGCF